MNELEITIESHEQAVVVTLKGSAGMEGNTALRDALRKVAANPLAAKVLVNMEQLAFTSSLGLGALIEAHTQLQHHGAELVLVNPNPAVMKVLKTTQLVRLFKIQNSLREALGISATD
ncbi:MAG: STAS domain-containing protein [Sedimentisphaerales bacterium]|nr:STAS domain-containing protein [Sedimentisphaerales bacterium]